MAIYGQWSYEYLSSKTIQMGATSNGPKVYFAGGIVGDFFTTKVHVYNLNTKSWSALSLSRARALPAAVSILDNVIFAGGYEIVTSDIVDIFDVNTNIRKTVKLSEPRFSIAAVAYGSRVLFAGGANIDNLTTTKKVDIYHLDTDTWSADSLSQARAGMAFVVAGDKAFFAGGYDFEKVSDRVDIYNFNTGKWDTARLSLPRCFASAAYVGSKVVIAGGVIASDTTTDRVDIYDTVTDTWTVSALSEPKGFIDNATAACNKAYFVGGCNLSFQTNMEYEPHRSVDIYDPNTGTWEVQYLKDVVLNNAVTSNGSLVFSAGGTKDLQNAGEDTNLVEIFDCSTSGIDEANIEMLQIVPNPAMEHFRVDVPAPFDLEC
ncbi:MAG: hypothetical protein IPP49_10615 [Saprospiraceae bacterium]|nr:hypothetical protein [Saprospiraceae bacterium]